VSAISLGRLRVMTARRASFMGPEWTPRRPGPWMARVSGRDPGPEPLAGWGPG